MDTQSQNTPGAVKSTTMRIDLIPDIADVPLSEKPRALLVVTNKGAARRAPAAAASAAHGGGYSELFQNLYDAGIVTDLRGRVRDVNPRAVEFFGHGQDAFTHLNISDIIAGADDELIRALHENLRNQCFTLMRAYCLRSDGTAFPAEVAVSQIRLSVPHLCFFVRDETVRRRMDEMLRTEHNALQNSGDAIIVTDLESRVDYANPAAVALWGFSAGASPVGMDFAQLFADGAAAGSLLASLSADHFSASGALVARRMDGLAFNAEFRAACNRDSDGNVTGAVISFTDLTERERRESVEADAARLRDMVGRLAETKDLIRRRVADLLAVFERLAEYGGGAGGEFRALVANGADCASALEALTADAGEQTA